MRDTVAVFHNAKTGEAMIETGDGTFVLSAFMLATTRCSVQRQCKPFSINSRDILAIAVASVVRASRKESSEFIIDQFGEIPRHADGDHLSLLIGAS